MVTPIKQLKHIIPLFLFLALLFSWSRAHASSEHDRVYQLESLAWLVPSDNADGIFTDFLNDQYSQYFKIQNRFQIRKLNGLSDVFKGTKTPYPELIQQASILKAIAQKFKVESLIRTQVSKEGETYHFTLQWVYAPRGDVLSQNEFRFIDPGKETGFAGSDLPSLIKKSLDQLILKLPFLGQITGVEGDTLTLNLGHNQGVSSNEILVLATLEGVKRHPIDNTIEEWQWKEVGKAQIETVEESLSFAKIIEVREGQKILPFQKIKEILPAPVLTQKTDETKEEKNIPRLGWAAGNLGIGSYSREVSAFNGTAGATGGGLLTSFEGEGFLWLNSRWLTQAALSMGLFKYNPQDLITGTPSSQSYTGTETQFRLAVGYAFFPAKTIFDPMGWVHAGFKSTHYSIAENANDYTGDSTFKSLIIGIGGEVPIDERFSTQLSIDLGLLKAVTQNSAAGGSLNSSADVMFTLGGIYHYEGNLYLRLLLKINSQSMDFSEGDTISQKTFSVTPSLLFYF